MDNYIVHVTECIGAWTRHGAFKERESIVSSLAEKAQDRKRTASGLTFVSNIVPTLVVKSSRLPSIVTLGVNSKII